MADGAIKPGQGLGRVGGVAGVPEPASASASDALDEFVVAVIAVVGLGKRVTAKWYRKDARGSLAHAVRLCQR